MPYSLVLERASGTHIYSVQQELSLLTSTCSVVYLLPQVQFNKLRLAALEVLIFHFPLVPWSAAERNGHIYGKIKQDIGQMLRKLCEYKGIEIIEAEACKDHIHMLVSIPPKYSVSQIMGYLKGKSSLMIYEKYANMKYKYGNRHFWCRGYYVSTVGRNRRAIEQYIRNQLQEDYTDDQMSIKEYIDPFTGQPVKEGK